MNRLKPYYLFALLIPVAFVVFFILNLNSVKPPIQNNFCTSIKTTGNTSATLYRAAIPLKNFDTLSNKFNLLNYVGSIVSPDSFRLQVKGAQAHDTISFTAVNFFVNGHIYTLSKDQFSTLQLSSNVTINPNSPNLSLLVSQPGDVWITMSNPLKWQPDNITHFKWVTIVVIFVLAFIVLLLINPSGKQVYIATVFSVIAMSFFWWLGQDTVSQIKLTNTQPIYNLYFYYNDVPTFSYEKQIEFEGLSINKSTQIFIDKYPFIQIGFGDKTQKIDDLTFKISEGCIGESWQLKNTSPGNITANDINYNAATGTYSVSGHNPYLCLTSTYFYSQLLKIAFLRSLAFLIISLVIFYGILIGVSFYKGTDYSHLFTLIAFIILLFSCLVYVPFNSVRTIMDVEKRNATKVPILGEQPLDKFAKAMDKFINDQMPGRIELITLNNIYKHKVYGGLPSQNPYVQFGKDGWLFYVGNFIGDEAREIYENKHPLTGDQLKQMREILIARRDWLKKMHIKYYLVMPRMPQFIYPEEVGDGLQQYNSPDKYTQLMTYLKETTDLNIIDIYHPIMAAKKKYKRDLYYRVDSHWNSFGSYFAYRTIIDTIRKDFPQIPPPIPLDSIKFVESDNTEGDLAKLASLNTVMKRHEYTPENPRYDAYKKLPVPDYARCNCVAETYLFQSYNLKLPRMLMFRDSYSLFLAGYLSSHFSHETYVWTQEFMPDIIVHDKPDIVISEIVDRFIYSLLHANPSFPDPQHPDTTTTKTNIQGLQKPNSENVIH